MIDPVSVAALGAVISTLVELTTRYWRRRSETPEDVAVVTEAGEVLREASRPPATPSSVRGKAPVITVGSRQLDADDVVRIVKALQPATKDESWVAKHGATLLVGLIAAAATVFTVVAPDQQEAPDCVAYVHELASLKSSFPAADAEKLFGVPGISFGKVEAVCGTPESFFGALD